MAQTSAAIRDLPPEVSDPTRFPPVGLAEITHSLSLQKTCWNVPATSH